MSITLTASETQHIIDTLNRTQYTLENSNYYDVESAQLAFSDAKDLRAIVSCLQNKL